MTNRDDDFEENSVPQGTDLKFGEGLAGIFMWLLSLACGVTMLAAIGVIAVQVLGWLRTGIWMSIPTSFGWEYIFHSLPTTEWVGIQTILDFMLSMPLSGSLFLIGLIVASVSLFDVRGRSEDANANNSLK